MITHESLPPVRELLGKARASGRPIGLVPTMGALHEGHLSLVRQCRAAGAFTVVSIFVNPLQFAAHEDLSRYPRRPADDAALLEREEADLVYAPRAEAFYPPEFSTSVEVREVSDGGEGAVRPEHFRGVATVVAKLFLQIQPDVAFFGRKDLQQVAVVRRMVRDLDFPVRIAVGDTVREADGLALSSRNAYLSAEERGRAGEFPRALFAAQDRCARGERDARTLERETRDALVAAGFAIDYVQVVDPETMRPAARVTGGTALAAAIRLGKTRLIDNVLLLEER